MNEPQKRKDMNKKMGRCFFLRERLHSMVWPMIEYKPR